MKIASGSASVILFGTGPFTSLKYRQLDRSRSLQKGKDARAMVPYKKHLEL